MNKKTVVAYAAGVPNAHKSPHKVEVLKRFIQGVVANGDNGILHAGNNILESDVNMIQGWVHANSVLTSHLKVRKYAVEEARLKGKHSIMCDSNLFNYDTGKFHPMHYSRYSMDGVFPTTGNYFSDNPDPNRWKQIQQDLGLSLKDWRSNGVHILICTQRNGGWSMSGLPVVDWLDKTIKQLRKFTDRPIIVRGHPGDKHAVKYLNKKKYNVSVNPKIVQDFQNAWATITYNSSPGVASAIEGIPLFVTDPTPQISQAFPVANTDLSQIETPDVFERQQWIEKLAMSHWKFQELTDGSAWAHMRDYV
jgi:hypothetical protein